MKNYTFHYFKIFFIIFALCFINLYSLKADDRKSSNQPLELSSSQNPWRSVGIIEMKNKKCVAVVIGRNLLLTSSYCLLDNNSNKDNPIENMIFKSGFQNNFYLIKSKIKSFVMHNVSFPPRYINDAKSSWSLLFTSEDILDTTGAIQIYREPITTDYLKSHKIITVGYSKDHPNNLVASIKCSFNESAIKVNDTSFIESKSAPILIQNCKDYFKPLVGSMVLSIDKDNNISIVGIISASFETKKKNVVEYFNVVVPMTSLQNKQKENQNGDGDGDNNQLLKQSLSR